MERYLHPILPTVPLDLLRLLAIYTLPHLSETPRALLTTDQWIDWGHVDLQGRLCLMMEDFSPTSTLTWLRLENGGVLQHLCTLQRPTTLLVARSAPWHEHGMVVLGYDHFGSTPLHVHYVTHGQSQCSCHSPKDCVYTCTQIEAPRKSYIFSHDMVQDEHHQWVGVALITAHDLVVQEVNHDGRLTQQHIYPLTPPRNPDQKSWTSYTAVVHYPFVVFVDTSTWQCVVFHGRRRTFTSHDLHGPLHGYAHLKVLCISHTQQLVLRSAAWLVFVDLLNGHVTAEPHYHPPQVKVYPTVSACGAPAYYLLAAQSLQRII